MRAAFGLVGLLVVVGIIMLLFSTYSLPVAKRGKQAQDEVREIAGRDENNAPVTDAITLDAQDRNGRMEGAVVTDITAGSAIEKKYGLQKGDLIIALGPLTVKDHISSAGEARDFLLDAYQKNQPVIVMRGWERLTLPLDPAAAAAAPAPPPPPVGQPAPGDAADTATAPQPDPAPPQPPAKQKPGGLEGQLDLIRNIPGQ